MLLSQPASLFSRLTGAVCLAFGLTQVATAVPIKWTVQNGQFSDGGVFTGYFFYDPDSGQIGERTISASGGQTSIFPAVSYTNASSVAVYSPYNNPQPTLVMQLNGSTRQLRMTPASALTNAGGSVFLNLNTANDGAGGAECFNCGPARLIVNGRLYGTPASSTFAITPALAGNWYDPAQNGHGMQFEILPNNVATVFWFTFDNVGNQVWINGAGTITGNRIVMDAGRVLNGRFPPNFNPAVLERRPWGTLTFEFTDCNHGSVSWSSTDADFTPSGAMVLERLTSLSGLSCQ